MIESTLSVLLFKKCKYFDYKSIRFWVNEIEWSDPVDFNTMHKIMISIPQNLMLNFDIVHVCYVVKFWGRTDTMERKDACRRLANIFVHDVLPLIDFEIRKLEHNEEIERALDVLD